MEKKQLKIEYLVTKLNELSSSEYELVLKADQAARKAYAPYSRFQVGASLVLDDGTFISGSNQENSAFPVSMCAERVALYTAHHMHPNNIILKLAVSAYFNNTAYDKIISPCGSCRQVIQEYSQLQNKPIEVYLRSSDDTICIFRDSKALLPFAFFEDAFKIK